MDYMVITRTLGDAEMMELVPADQLDDALSVEAEEWTGADTRVCSLDEHRNAAEAF